MDEGAAQNIIDAGANRTEIAKRVTVVEHDGVRVPVGIASDGTLSLMKGVVDHIEARAASPAARVCAVTIDDVDALVAYVNRQKLDGQTVAFARKQPGPTVVVVFDWHRANAGQPGWQRDRATYSPKLSRQFVSWMALAKEPIGQDAFADYLEDNLDDVAEREGFPLKTELVKMARDLHVSIGHKFQRTVDTQTGDVTLVATSDSNQSKTKVPREILLGIPVFDGSTVLYAIRFGLRLELRQDKALFVLKPRNADVALEDAFGDVKKAIAEKCEIPVFSGQP